MIIVCFNKQDKSEVSNAKRYKKPNMDRLRNDWTLY